jgi:hypothetical protein
VLRILEPGGMTTSEIVLDNAATGHSAADFLTSLNLRHTKRSCSSAQ